jgi:ribose 5-phosphate isomerase RpiB
MPGDVIAIASDHAGFGMKSALAEWLRGLGYEILDLGAHGSESVDYPDYADRMAEAVRAGHASASPRTGIASCVARCATTSPARGSRGSTTTPT